ncbi:MAG: non-homologous end-joining DNA ligase [Nitrospirota bacterium]
MMKNRVIKEAQSHQEERTITVDGHILSLTNQNKIYFPDDRITKGQIIDYYDVMYLWMRPYLQDRPQSLLRHPNGIADKGFFHKDAGEEAPSWVKTIQIYSKSNDKIIDYIVCNNKATLLYLNNLGCIEINPWFSRIQHLDNPDFFVIDIDPSPQNTFDQVVDAALAVKEVLDKAGAYGYCKTSGATGLHVFVPLGACYTYDEVKDFSHMIATLAQELLPDTTSVERTLNKRKNKIYMDFLQNRKSQTLACAYSVRPRAGAPVSTPLKWSEVKHGLHPSQFTIKNIQKRLAKIGDLFLPVVGKGINVRTCLKNLGI